MNLNDQLANKKTEQISEIYIKLNFVKCFLKKQTVLQPA